MWKSIQNRLDSSESYVSLALGLAVVLVIGTLIFNALSRKSPGQTGTTGAPESTISAEGKVPGKHTVKDGDTLWTLAEKYYQNAYNWVDIKAANPTIGDSNELVVGQELIIPEVKPAPVGEISATSTEVPAAAPATEEKPAASGRQVTVVRGDTLWAIAEREYNNPYKWVDIAKANNLDNPDLIHAGNVFVLP